MRFSLQTGPDGAPTPPSAPTGDLPSLAQSNRRKPSGLVKALGLLAVVAGVAAAVIIGVGVPGGEAVGQQPVRLRQDRRDHLQGPAG